MTKLRILFVEDEAPQRKLVSSILQAEGHTVTQASSAEEGETLLAEGAYDLVLSDWKLPGRNGYQLLEFVRENYNQLAFIIVTAYGSIDLAVKAVRAGADDFLTKPFVREALLLALERVAVSRKIIDENRRLHEALEDRNQLVDLVGRAPEMQKIFRRVSKLAVTDATILITGESGTGKELTARALHTLSRRKDEAFVAVNCAAIPEGLMESEFFGADKGAYTGADRSRIGRFEAAAKGTLFLDEVGELPLSIQPKLLRVLQEGTYQKVGGVKEQKTDIRLVAATNRNLVDEVAAGRFREDLYYRLNVVPIELPPLRERREDVPILIQHFIELHARKHGIEVGKPPAKLLKKLVDYHWPGNARELANVVERLILLCEDGQLSADDLPGEILGELHEGGAGKFVLPPGGLSWEAHERDCLCQALSLAGGNRRRAAQLLNLGYKAFIYRLEKHNL